MAVNQSTALHQAVLNEHVDCEKVLLKAGADVHATNKDGDTALILAIKQLHDPIVKLLLEKGANVNKQGTNCASPLYVAVKVGHTHSNHLSDTMCPASGQQYPHHAILLDLLRAGADLNLFEPGKDPCAAHLHLDSPHDPAILQILYAAGGTLSEENIMQTLDMEMKPMLQTICRDFIRQFLTNIHPALNLFATVSMLPLPFFLQSFLLYNVGFSKHNVQQSMTNSSLLKAAEKGNLFELESFINNADVNTRKWNGETPLMLASAGGHKDCVSFLLEAGAEVNLQGNSKTTALVIATQHKQPLIVAQLLEAGADMLLQDKHGWTAVHWAAVMNNPSGQQDSCLNTLIQNGADVNTPDLNGYTPLHAAVSNKQEENVKILLQYGASGQRFPSWIKQTILHKQELYSCLTLHLWSCLCSSLRI